MLIFRISFAIFTDKIVILSKFKSKKVVINKGKNSTMKVYVIEKGCYSDRYVVGVVETEQEANRVVEILENSGCEDVGYSVFDTKQFQTDRLRFQVRCEFGEWEVEYDDWHDAEYTENTEIYEDCWMIYAPNPEKAIKIAQDMRAERLASKLL